MTQNGKLLKDIMANLHKPKKVRTPKNQWQTPGQVTDINSRFITMGGVGFDAVGVGADGTTQYMQDGQDYYFPVPPVREFPMMQKGGLVRMQPGGEKGWFSSVAEDFKKFFGIENEQPQKKTVQLTMPELLQIYDPRKVSGTTGKPINPNVELLSGKYPGDRIYGIVRAAKRYGIDPYDALAIDMQETGFGQRSDAQIGHTKMSQSELIPTLLEEGQDDPYDFFARAVASKMKYADKLGYKDPTMRFQTYNGLGMIYPETEKNYHGFKMQSIYGVPLPKQGINMKKNPLYGKRVIDIRDNILKKNDELNMYIRYIKKAGGPVRMDEGGDPKPYFKNQKEREAYRQRLKAESQKALTTVQDDAAYLINTPYHSIEDGNNCINGICGLNISAGLQYNNPSDGDRFLGNTKFSDAVRKGQEDYYLASGNFNIGDHIQYLDSKGKPGHSKMIYDVATDDQGNKSYKVINNSGGKQFKDETYSEAELKDMLAGKMTSPLYKRINIYRPGKSLDQEALEAEREAKTSPEARAAMKSRKRNVAYQQTYNPDYQYSIREDSPFYGKETEGMKRFLAFANNDANMNSIIEKLDKVGLGSKADKDIVHDSVLNVFGILGQENKWENPWFGGNILPKGSPVKVPLESTLERIFTPKSVSIGPGQIKFDQINPQLRKEFGINKPKDLNNWDKVLPLMVAMDVSNRKWMENQGDKLSERIIGEPGLGSNDMAFSDARMSPYFWQGPGINNLRKFVGQQYDESVEGYRIPKKVKEQEREKYISENIREYQKVFDQGSYGQNVFENIDQNLQRTSPTFNQVRTMPEVVVKGKKMQKGGPAPIYVDNSVAQKGKTLPTVNVKKQPIYVDNPNDPRLRAYNDSLYAYNISKDIPALITKQALEQDKLIERDPNNPGSVRLKSNPNSDWKEFYKVMTPFQEKVLAEIKKATDPVNKYIEKTGKNPTEKVSIKDWFGYNPETKTVKGLVNSDAFIFKKPVQPVVYRKPEVPILYVDDLNDPRLKKYNDSLSLYNTEGAYLKEFRDSYTPAQKKAFYKAQAANYNFSSNNRIEPVRGYKSQKNAPDGNPDFVSQYKKPVQRVEYRKQQSVAPAVQQVTPQPVVAPSPAPLRQYSGSPVYSPGAGSGIGSALIGFRSDKGDTTYIQPDDYQRYAVPKYAQDYIGSLPKQQKGGSLPRYQAAGWVQRAADANLNFWEKCGLSQSAGSGSGAGRMMDFNDMQKQTWKERTDPYAGLSGKEKRAMRAEYDAAAAEFPGLTEEVYGMALRDASDITGGMKTYGNLIGADGRIPDDAMAPNFYKFFINNKLVPTDRTVTHKDMIQMYNNMPGGFDEGYKKIFIDGFVSPKKRKGGEMIRRADGSYSRRGLWDNIRANAGSGKKPTKQMLEQERKIKTKEMKNGGINNPGFEALPEHVQAKILSSMGYGGYFNPMMAAGGEPNGEMALGQMASVSDKMRKLLQFVKPDQNLDPWIASKLAVMDHSADAIADYMMYGPETQEMQEDMEMMANGGYTVTRSRDRKGKTHKVTGPDGAVKYFGDSKLGQHPKDPERKKAFYARHKKNLANNPYFRAFARKTWQDGGEMIEEMANGGYIGYDGKRHMSSTPTWSGNAGYEMGGYIPEAMYGMGMAMGGAPCYECGGGVYKMGGGINIDPKNKGKFTAAAKKAGMGVQEFANHVMANKEDYSSTQVKRANFARNAAKWNKQEGGPVVGDEMNVTPEQLELLRAQGYEFEII